MSSACPGHTERMPILSDPSIRALHARRLAHASLAAALTVALLMLGAFALAPGTAEARKAGKQRQFEGRVVAVNRSSGVFVQRRPRGRVRIKVVRRKGRRGTRFQDLRHFRALRKGVRVQTRARYNGSRWVARVVDRDGDSDSDTDSDRDRDVDSDTDADSDSD